MHMKRSEFRPSNRSSSISEKDRQAIRNSVHDNSRFSGKPEKYDITTVIIDKKGTRHVYNDTVTASNEKELSDKKIKKAEYYNKKYR